MTRIDQLRRGGLVLDVDDSGPEDGPVAVLLHGFPADRSTWRAVTPLLTAEGLRVVAPDQRGYAVGARPEGRRAYRRDWLVDDVLALADRLGAERLHLVGHDWGGLVAWRLAQRAPDRLASLTVLATPHPRAMALAAVRSDQALRSWYIAAFQVPWLPERLLRGRLVPVLESMGLARATAERYDRRMREPGALRAAIDWYRALALPTPAGTPRVDPLVRVPTSYLWGSRDAALGRVAAEATERYVAAPYRFVAVDEDHWLPENAAALVAEVVLDRVRSVTA
ncbi:alpha/beta fold hydrolase [Curtobacterium sp. MCBD17_019]|uniref:alpha/beta fold hydrolase n=1 Tax=Curtobacterium sp. MCBD17_019 TaxID=2175669 RepID=UPI000DA70073|nr:alpha/beta fold hydrolase [Curtobacterium sp. MCBD17_019]PZE75388.1 alpha/beta hydrolase [Curtobacterium sp. MCBD17_019]